MKQFFAFKTGRTWQIERTKNVKSVKQCAGGIEIIFYDRPSLFTDTYDIQGLCEFVLGIDVLWDED